MIATLATQQKAGQVIQAHNELGCDIGISLENKFLNF
jgi:hypothetical protein